MDSLNSISTNRQYTTFNLIPIEKYNAFQNIANELRVFIVEKGSVTGQLNGNEVTYRAPMIVCLNEKDAFTISESNKLNGKVLSFHPSIFSEYFDYDNVRSLEHSFSADDIKIILELSIFFSRYQGYNGEVKTSEPVIKQLLNMIEALPLGSEHPSSMSNRLLEIIAYIHRLVKTNSILSSAVIAETSFEVKDVLLYLHNNYKNKITIPELSKHFHVNRTTLSDRFYEATGETIITYLNKHRINLSAILLRESKLCVSDIADEVGFNDTAYFAKLFRKYMNHSPSGYRERYYALTQQHKVDDQEKSY